MTWAQISEVMVPTAIYYRDLWRCPVPAYNQAPSTADELECEVWCRKLAANLADPIFPPAHLQGWILVRFACLAAAAKWLDKSSLPQPATLDPKTVAWLLVDLWRELLRDLLPKLGDSGFAFPA